MVCVTEDGSNLLAGGNWGEGRCDQTMRVFRAYPFEGPKLKLDERIGLLSAAIVGTLAIHLVQNTATKRLSFAQLSSNSSD